MTSTGWVWVALAFAAGGGLAALILELRHRRERASSTLVPHRTRQVVATLRSGGVIVRRDRRAAFANNAAAALGIARLDGKLHPGVADLAEEAWAADGVVEREIEVSRGVLGTSSMVHVRVTPLDSQLAFAVANDASEARAAEEARRDFAVNVSHELKTPIGALRLLAETIDAAAEDPEKVRRFARKIRKETKRLHRLVQEIIQISRIQGADTVLEAEPVALAEAVQEAVEAATLALEGKEVEVDVQIRATPITMGDHDLLVMALRNLVDNAIAYSDEGKRVAVTLDVDDRVASISVIDQGIGIAPKDVDRIFERFYRADPARSRQTGGTGLGLSIVKHVAAQHAGAIEVWSQEGIGSTFTLKLPVHQEAP